jgi:hypothetical protein
VLGHLLDSRYYRTHDDPGHASPAGKYSAKRRGYVVSMGQDLGAIKISGWTHTIPEYFDLDRFWERYPGAAAAGGVLLREDEEGDGVSPALRAHVWGMHHRYPTNSPALDAEGRGNPAGAHPFKAYNVLLMHNGEQVGVDSTSPFLREFGYVHVDESMGEGAALYEGDSLYDRKALTDTEYAAYLIDFTRRVLGLSTEEASQIISPITGIDLAAVDDERRRRFELLGLNYVQLTPTGPYKFTIVESRPGEDDGALAPSGSAMRAVSWAATRVASWAAARARRRPMSRATTARYGLAVSAFARTWTSSSCGRTSSSFRSTPVPAVCRRSPTAARPRSPTRCCVSCIARARWLTPVTTCASACGRAATRGAASSAASSRRSCLPARAASTWPTALASRSWRLGPDARRR